MKLAFYLIIWIFSTSAYGSTLELNDHIDFKLNGRIMFDVAGYSQDRSTLHGGSEIRATRFTLSGKLYQDWFFKAQYDFAGNRTNIKELYIGRTLGNSTLIIGDQKVVSSIGAKTSSSYTTFMNLPSILGAIGASAGKLGLSWTKNGELVHFQLAVFGEGSQANSKKERLSESFKVWLSPEFSATGKAHIGLAVVNSTNDESFAFSSAAETHIDGMSFVSTGAITDIDQSIRYHSEVAATAGPVAFQAEYIVIDSSRETNKKLNFSGSYIQVSYFVTGEQRPYKKGFGLWGAVTPNQNFGESSWGAFEIALRYSDIDLDDDNILGGSMNVATLGVNWYLYREMRLMLNHSLVQAEKTGVSDNPSVTQARFQLFF